MTRSNKARRRALRGKSFDLDDLTFEAAAAFDDLQGAYLKAGPGSPGTPRWPQALLLFEAIGDLEDLHGIQTTGVVYQDGLAHRLDWVRPDGRRDARHLSCISVLALEADGLGPRAGGRLVEVIGTWFKEVAPRRLLGREAPAAAAVRCSSAWLQLKLPPHLFEHVMGVTPMTPLDRTTAARIATGLALLPEASEACADSASVSALDAYFNSAGNDSERTVLKEILDAASLKGSSRLDDGALLNRMARRWRGLVDAAELAGPITSLLLAHVIDLAERKALVPRSLVPYVKCGAPAVMQAFKGKELEQMSAEQLGTAITDSLGQLGLTGEPLRKAKAFLGLFLRYARQWLELARVPASALPDVDEPDVDANVVSPHEVARIRTWLAQDASDPRLSEQTDLVLCLLQHLEVRVSEVFFLQMRNVRVSAGVIELEVARLGRLHGLKSSQAQQVRVIRDPDLAARMTSWQQRRSDEGGQDPDLLFGTRKAQRRVYRLATMYAWLNAALKQTTGLRAACCHWLRHGVIDSRFVRISLGPAAGDSLDQLSVDASHLDRKTTQLNYLHSYPIAIRCVMDRLLHQRRLPSSWAAKWAGVSASKLRQDFHRGKPCTLASDADGPFNCKTYNWQAVAQAASLRTCESAEQGIQLREPTPPPALGVARTPTAADMIGLLQDWQRGVDPVAASRQWQFDDVAAAAALQRLLELGNARAQLQRHRIRARLTTPKAALLALGIQMSRALQPKYSLWLKSLDALNVPMLPAEVWQEWALARHGRYISLEPDVRSDRWLRHLLASGMPVSRLVICHVPRCPGEGCDPLQELEMAVASSLGAQAVTETRAYEVKPRKGRPKSYLLVADEADELTDRNGAAFSTAGLSAVMLALHLYTVASEKAQAAKS